MINIYLSDNNLYCAGKPFFAGSRSLSNSRQIRDILQLKVNVPITFTNMLPSMILKFRC